ncbi:hypothetical protein J6590_074545 [Homalodisca vitripennis]|nr:hypothetical protein J6590_074545 [Homalodisca vitripennis]
MVRYGSGYNGHERPGYVGHNVIYSCLRTTKHSRKANTDCAITSNQLTETQTENSVVTTLNCKMKDTEIEVNKNIGKFDFDDLSSVANHSAPSYVNYDLQVVNHQNKREQKYSHAT